ncbi:MAG: archaetidylserine decarboxylase [Pseudomonadota bacterium]
MSSLIPDSVKAGLIYILPHHAISRCIFFLTRIETRYAQPVMRWFCRQFNVDLSEAANSELTHYTSFNDFFTRELRPDARTITADPGALACPVDGTVSQAGTIQNQQLFQAKGRTYSLLALLGADHWVETFSAGRFATLYLSPRDYHRIHMPLDGTLLEMTHVPGRLFSVAPHTVRSIDSVFARNERVVTIFDTPAGKIALILVGAINVAAIETVWAGLVTPPTRWGVSHTNYSANDPISLNKGDEMGRFNMGSTVIVLAESGVTLSENLDEDTPVRLGQVIGSFSPE